MTPSNSNAIASQPATGGKVRVKLLGVAKESTRTPGTFVVVETAEVGQKYGLRCPKCGRGFAVQPSEPGARQVCCPQCHTTIIYVAVATETDSRSTAAKPTATPDLNDSSSHTVMAGGNGMHLMGAIAHGKWVFRKMITLRVGANYIGRADQRNPSDIEFDDNNMSARSVRIDVNMMDSGGYSFKFTVLRATNPVYVNGTQYQVGESVYLNFGDKLRMGTTKLEFIEAKK